ncbi:MAG: SDR family NAD(P)-dependent oxidoreductase [Betaproteobacteria bacterium]
MAQNPPITDWRGKAVWLIGASSGIGLATAAALHQRGAQVVVSARQDALLQDFVAAHPGARACALDVTDAPAVRVLAGQLLAQGPLDLVVYCVGHYKAQRAYDFDLTQMLQHQQINYVGALYVLDAVLPAMLARGSGHLSLIASVAGYRGLPKSLAYGPTKAALINLAETLYGDLQPHGIGVSLVNPGFVQTPLTAQNRFHMPALITPEEAAREMLAGWQRGRFEIHYPRRFTYVMKLLRSLPYALYLPLLRRMVKEQG